MKSLNTLNEIYSKFICQKCSLIFAFLNMSRLQNLEHHQELKILEVLKNPMKKQKGFFDLRKGG